MLLSAPAGGASKHISAFYEGRRLRRRPSPFDTVNIHICFKWWSSFGASWGSHQATAITGRGLVYMYVRMKHACLYSNLAWLRRPNAEPLRLSQRKTAIAIDRIGPHWFLVLLRLWFTCTLTRAFVYAVGSPTCLSEVHYESIGYQP